MKSDHRITGMAIWSKPLDQMAGWIPCEHPERPLDENAAVVHVVHGKPCGACAIARDAAVRRAAEEGRSGP